jgi:sensor histidine kinase YesM
MGYKENGNNNYTPGNYNTRKFWLRAFIVYTIAEIGFIITSYLITYFKCKVCVLPVPFYVCIFLISLLLALFLWYSLSYFSRQSLWKVVAGNVLIFGLYYFCITGVIYLLLNAKQEWLVWPVKHRSYTSVVYGSWGEIGKYVLKLSAFYMLKFYTEYRKAGQQRIQLAVINKDMQLNLLKQQLSPHFYFNTLNNLYGLSRSNSPRLSTALSQLSNIMQYVIVECNQPKVLLRQEINFLQSYIELEKLRYEKDTVIEIDVQGNVNEQTIIPLLLIQFVENAFKHGMKEKSNLSWMKVSMSIVDKELLFEVENSYYDTAPSHGIGINSVRHILNLQYEGRHDIQMRHENNSFSVTLKLNLS